MDIPNNISGFRQQTGSHYFRWNSAITPAKRRASFPAASFRRMYPTPAQEFCPYGNHEERRQLHTVKYFRQNESSDTSPESLPGGKWKDGGLKEKKQKPPAPVTKRS